MKSLLTKRFLPALIFLSLLPSAFAQVCGGNATGAGSLHGHASVCPNQNPIISIAIVPASQTLTQGFTASYNAIATFTDGMQQDITALAVWHSSDITIASIGAVAKPIPITCLPSANGTVTLTSVFEGLTGSANLTCSPVPFITTTSLPAGTIGVPYTASISATGGTPPYSWSISSGALPSWATLNNTSPIATITGTPTTAATTPFTVQVSDSGANLGTQALSITISPVTQQFPTLPQRWVNGRESLLASYTNTATINNSATWSCHGSSKGPYAVSLAGLNLAIVDAEACRAANGDSTKIVVPHGTLISQSFVGNSSYVKLKQTGGDASTSPINITSDAPLPTNDPLTGAPRDQQVGTYNIASSAGLVRASGVVTVHAMNTFIVPPAVGDLASLWIPDDKSFQGQYVVCGPPLCAAPTTTSFQYLQPSDLLNWMSASIANRTSVHLTGSGNPHYSWMDFDGQKFWFEKSSSGHPWDINTYNQEFISHWITENGDAADQAACAVQGYSSCFINPNAYKRFLSPNPIMPRFLVPGQIATIDTPGPNTLVRTTLCELPGDFTNINLGPTHAVTFFTSGDALHGGAGWGVFGVQQTLENDYYYGLSGGVYLDREIFQYLLGVGLVQWTFQTWNGTAYVNSQVTTDTTTTAGGAPVPAFSCYNAIQANWIGGPPGNVGNAPIPAADPTDATSENGIVRGFQTQSPISSILASGCTTTGVIGAACTLTLTFPSPPNFVVGDRFDISNSICQGCITSDPNTLNTTWNVASVSNTSPTALSTNAVSPGTGADGGAGSCTWANPSNLATGGTTTCSLTSASQLTNFLNGSNFGFSIPSTATINGIQVTLNTIDNAASFSNHSTDHSALLLKAGVSVGTNLASGTTIANTGTTLIYGGPTSLWGTTWTPTDINLSSFGFQWNAQAVTVSVATPDIPTVSSETITIFYTPANCIGCQITVSSYTEYVGNGASASPAGVALHYNHILADQVACCMYTLEETAGGGDLIFGDTNNYHNYLIANAEIRSQLNNTVAVGTMVNFAPHDSELTPIPALSVLGCNGLPAQPNCDEPTHIGIDRSYIHAYSFPLVSKTADLVISAVHLDCSYCYVTNSVIKDIHQNGVESHGVFVKAGVGPFKLVDNVIEGTTENFFYGYAPYISGLPQGYFCDSEIRRNFFTRNRFEVMNADGKIPNGTGNYFTYFPKNQGEFKNVCQALLDGNVFENSAGGPGEQDAVLTGNNSTANNQTNNSPPLGSQSHDVTYSNNIYRHAYNVGYLPTRSGGADTINFPTHHYGWFNNLIYDIGNVTIYGRNGWSGTSWGQSIADVVQGANRGQNYTGCSGTSAVVGGVTIATLTCAQPTPCAPAIGQTSCGMGFQAGDWVEVAGCSDTNYNVVAPKQVPALTSDPTLSNLTFQYVVPSAAGPTVSGCTANNSYGHEQNTTFMHNTSVTNYNISNPAYANKFPGNQHGFGQEGVNGGNSASVEIMARDWWIQNNIFATQWPSGVSGANSNFFFCAPNSKEGTTAEQICWDSNSLVWTNNAIVGNTPARYTEYNCPASLCGANNGVSPPVTDLMGLTNACAGTPDKTCIGFLANYVPQTFGTLGGTANPANVPDFAPAGFGFDGFTLSRASYFANPNAGQANDGTDNAVDLNALYNALGAQIYVCPRGCASGPFN